MSDFIRDLERDLVAAARRRTDAAAAGRGAPPPWRSMLLAGVIVAVSASTAAGGTLMVLRGSPIPAPAARDVPPEQTPVPTSQHVAAVRAKDPGGGAPWALRIARSRTGFVCGTVGQIAGGEFGLVGLDHRFRLMGPRIVDSCGQEQRNAASLVGVRVFDARRAADVRTVVNGVAGGSLRRVTVQAGGVDRDVAVGAGGVFIAALRGYPEDIGVTVTMRFADGHTERHPFGVSRFVVPDPAGGRAWKVEAFGFGQPLPAGCRRLSAARSARCRPNGPVEVCARFRPAREVLNPPFSDAVCGRFSDPRRRRGYFFGVRRQVPGPAFVPGDFYAAGWKHHPPRTAVFGIAGEDVAGIEVDGPGGWRALTLTSGGAFLAVYGPAVRPDQLTVRVRMRDGHVFTHHGDTNLVTPRRRP